MSLIIREILQILNNNEECISKRIRLVENAFKYTELTIRKKEAVLLLWSLENYSCENREMDNLVYSLFSSEQFKSLNHNDLSNEDIETIIELINNKLDVFRNKRIVMSDFFVKSLYFLLQNITFEQYFLHNLEKYSIFLSKLLDGITEKELFLQCLTNQKLFRKKIIIKDEFYKYFIKYIVPILVNKLLEFKEDKTVFEEVSNLIQKGIFLRGYNFSEQRLDKKTSGAIKAVSNFLISSYNLKTVQRQLCFKLIFYSCISCNDVKLSFKIFIMLNEILGFNLPKKISVNKIMPKNKVLLDESLKILLILLEIVSQKNISNMQYKNISLTEFLHNLLKSIMFLNCSCSLVYQIFLKAISINPLIIEPIVNQIVVFSMLSNNENHLQDYENLLIATLEIFAKLHRVEKLISKILKAIQSSLQDEQCFTEVYPFCGINNLELEKSENIFIQHMLTEHILTQFSNIICQLASSQVITLLRTLLFHLKQSSVQYVNISKKDAKAQSNIVFLEVITKLVCCVLQSIKIAEYIAVNTTITKFLKCLEDLQQSLIHLTTSLLQKPHDNRIVKVYLNLSYYWAEIYGTLAYYGLDAELEKCIDNINNYAACNLTYLHRYLTVEQWCSISERIHNFGDAECRNMLQNLYVQKVRTMLTFEKNVTEDIILNVLKDIQNNVDHNWKDFLFCKFCANQLAVQFDTSFLIHVVENLFTVSNTYQKHYIQNCSILTTAINYSVLSKISKLFKHNNQLQNTNAQNTKIFLLFPEELFIFQRNSDLLENTLVKCKEVLFGLNDLSNEIKVDEKKLSLHIYTLKKFPIIFCSQHLQKLMLVYLYSLFNDTCNLSANINLELEKLIIGILQNCKFNLLQVFDNESFYKRIITQCEKYEVIFSICIENIFKDADAIQKFKFCVDSLAKNIEQQRFMHSSLIFMAGTLKLKRSKMDTTVKCLVAEYRNQIADKLFALITKKEPSLSLIKAYTTVLKHSLTINNKEQLEMLLKELDFFCNFIFKESNINSLGSGHIGFFILILHNKQYIKMVTNDFILKVWNRCNKFDHISDFEEYYQLISLIIIMVSNDEFRRILMDLLTYTEDSIQNSNYKNLCNYLKIWETILTCNVNQLKMKMWQDVLEILLYKLLDVIKYDQMVEGPNLMENVVSLEENIIRTHHFMLTPTLVDMVFATPTILFSKNSEYSNFNLSMTILEKLLKYRNGLVMDRLPSFLQQFRLILSNLVNQSNSDSDNRILKNVKKNKLSDTAHILEKFSKTLVSHKKDMGRIAMYLVADILETYERITIHPNVKIHLNNCIYTLLSICDHHAISYLMRGLSNASTEMFKILYGNYKKYYLFTGKV